MAEQEKIRELDLSNKEDRKYLKNLIKDKIKSERPHQNAYDSYRAMKKGAKDYDLVIMSDGTVRNKRVQMNEAGKPKSSITESVAPVKKDTDDVVKELAKYKVSVTYEEPKAKSEGKPAAKQESKSNPKPESKSSSKSAAPSKSTKSDTSSKSTKKSDTGKEKASKQSNRQTSEKPNAAPSYYADEEDDYFITNERAKKYNIEHIQDDLYTLNGVPYIKGNGGFGRANDKYYEEKLSEIEQAKIDSITAANGGYYAAINLPEISVEGTRNVTPTDRAYARAYKNQHLGESKGSSYKQTPLLTRLRNWWNSEEEPSVQEAPVAKQEYYFAPIPNAQPVVPQHSKAYERQFRIQHAGEKGQTRREEKNNSEKDRNLLDFVWRVLNLSSAPSYKKGGILKARLGAVSPTPSIGIPSGSKPVNTSYGVPPRKLASSFGNNPHFYPSSFKKDMQMNNYYRQIYEKAGLKSFDEVKKLQRMLGVKDDGYIGEQTMNALKQYQFIGDDGKIRGTFDESGGFLPEYNKNGNSVILYDNGVVYVPNTRQYGNFKAMNGKLTTSGWGNRPNPYYAQGGVLKAQQGASIQTKNSNTPTLDAIMNNPQLAETFLAALSQQLGKEITLEDLATAAANPELGPQLEAIAQQMMKQQAKHGAKLNYIARLRNKCPEGQELVYYAKGGKICSACMGKKLEQGGKPKYMKDFEARQAKKGCKLKK